MKKRFQTMALALIVFALLSPAAFADVKTKTVTFQTDVKVGETLVKKGTYNARFDDQSKELTILKDKKVVAKTTASLKELKSTGRYEATYTTDKDREGNILVMGINFGSKIAAINSDRATDSPSAAVQ
jgi:hypothetical protein